MASNTVVNSNQQIEELKRKVAEEKEIAVLIGRRFSYDSLAAALGLTLILEEEGKEVSVASEAEITVGESGIFGVNKVGNKLAGRNLIISFDYVEGAVDKVSYNIEGNKFNLMISPKPGKKPLTFDRVKFKEGGGGFGLLFTVGVGDLSDLGKLYEGNRELLENSFIVNIDNKDRNKDFGRVNIINPRASTCSEIIAAVARHLKLKIPEDGASNLLSGIYHETDNLTKGQLQPETFEVIAFLMRAGGKIKKEEKKEEAKVVMEKAAKVEKGKEEKEKKEEGEEKEPPDDWLTPKVYRGGQLL